jgi:hypothetical protein
MLSACASHPDPIIDQKGVDMAQYRQDLDECKGYAEEISVVEGTAKGAAVGAVVGAAAGSIGGDAGQGAGYGGLAGGTKSGFRNQNTKERAVKKCIRGRGYKVLN